MNKGDIVRSIAAKTDSTQKDVSNFIDAFLSAVKETVARGESVTLVGFGKFHSIRREARTGRNPSTGKPLQIPAKTVPKFSPGKEFRDIVE
ncbi:HU family DNA-binding protein [bacterium]|nr:HU family DNA-binding protein [bacterium]